MRGVALELARPKKQLRELLDRAGLLDEIAPERLVARPWAPRQIEYAA
jgi:hypothetical protein